MKNIQSFRRTLIPSKSKIQFDVWENVVKLYEEGKFKDSLFRLFDYVDGNLVRQYGNAAKTEFTVPHGSVDVIIKISDSQVDINVPFLRLPEKNVIPLLRKATEINFSPLNIATIVLEGNELSFRYSTPLHLCEPWKMYSVFREICVNADNFDDEFIHKFGAARIKEPIIVNFTNEKKEEIWNTFQFLLNETKEYLEFFENKRFDGFLWDALIQLFLNIDYYIAPQGYLRTDMENVVNYMQDGNYSLHEKNEKGKAFFKKLQQISHDDLCSNLYVSQVFIPIKYAASLEYVRNTFSNQYETAKKEMNNSDYMGAALSIRYVFLYEFYYSYAPDDIVEIITNALENSSSKPWDEAARILWQAIDQIMTGNTGQQANRQTSDSSGDSFARNTF
ncbi:MAG: hypothetical protein U0W24_06325 [Bacteroidales bacterium]